MRFVVVTGPPGSGKSTLALRLAKRLDWPLIGKDDIKEAFGDGLDVGGQDWTERLSAASFEVRWAVAARCPRAVLEGNFYPGAAARLRSLDPHSVEIFCRCPLELCRDRFTGRFQNEGRHRVHPPVVPPLKFFEQFASPINAGSVLEVDTVVIPDVEAIVEWINEAR